MDDVLRDFAGVLTLPVFVGVTTDCSPPVA
jgi:hypothetical protein